MCDVDIVKARYITIVNLMSSPIDVTSKRSRYQDHVIEWPFEQGIHRSPVNPPHKGQWCGALMFSMICALNKRLSKKSWCWWFGTPTRSLWRHCNDERSWVNLTNISVYCFCVLCSTMSYFSILWHVSCIFDKFTIHLSLLREYGQFYVALDDLTFVWMDQSILGADWLIATL